MTPPPIEVRLATEADLQAIQAVLIKTWHELYEVLERRAQLSLRYRVPARLREELEDPRRQLLVATRGGEIVATAAGGDQGEGGYRIERIYVVPAEQDQGIGALLFDRLLEFAGAKPVHVEVDARNRRALDFYFGRGFTIVGEIERGDDPTAHIPYLVMRRPAP